VPELPANTPRWEQIAAHASHYGLYLLMLATTVTGWAMAGLMRTPLNKDAFGLSVPMIYVKQDRAMHDLFEDTHKILAYVLVILVVVHIAAALRHQFVKRNNVLRRMWS
jgi:cytochrome b561